MTTFLIIFIAVCTVLCSKASKEYKNNKSTKNKILLLSSLIFTIIVIVIYAFVFAVR